MAVLVGGIPFIFRTEGKKKKVEGRKVERTEAKHREQYLVPRGYNGIAPVKGWISRNLRL